MGKPKSIKATPNEFGFAVAVVSGCSYAEAYRRNYSTDNLKIGTLYNEAHRVRHRPHVNELIEHLRKQAADAAVVTRETMLVEMGHNREHAIDSGKIASAVTSSRDRARVAGLLERKRPGDGADIAAGAVQGDVSAEERSHNDIARRIAFALARARREGKGQIP